MTSILPTEEDLRFLIDLLAKEQERREGTSFGYAKDPNIFRLQNWASIALEVKRRLAEQRGEK